MTTANGLTYDLGDAAQRDEMLAAGLAYFTDRVRDGHSLRRPGRARDHGRDRADVAARLAGGGHAHRAAARRLERTPLDFVDLHVYPGWDLPLPLLAENVGLRPSRKPIVVGELGAYHFAFPTVDAAAAGLATWQAASCAYGVDGWLLWTWDTPTPTEPRMWSAAAENGRLAQALGPRARPDPCQPPATLSPEAP